MMQGFSPFTRRVVAVGILLFLLLGAVNLAILVGGAAIDSVDALRDARFRQARLVALQARPLPRPADPVPTDLFFAAPDRAAAARMVTAAINASAGGAQIPIENVALLPEDPAGPLLIRLNFSAVGPEASILRFVDALEKGRPAVRLRTWKIGRTGSEPAALRLEAQAIAVWSRPA